eukprot:7377353-Prymnesium_polylepis.1
MQPRYRCEEVRLHSHRLYSHAGYDHSSRFHDHIDRGEAAASTESEYTTNSRILCARARCLTCAWVRACVRTAARARSSCMCASVLEWRRAQHGESVVVDHHGERDLASFLGGEVSVAELSDSAQREFGVLAQVLHIAILTLLPARRPPSSVVPAKDGGTLLCSRRVQSGARGTGRSCVKERSACCTPRLGCDRSPSAPRAKRGGGCRVPIATVVLLLIEIIARENLVVVLPPARRRRGTRRHESNGTYDLVVVADVDAPSGDERWQERFLQRRYGARVRGCTFNRL